MKNLEGNPMQTFDLREAIIERVQSNDKNEFTNTITDSIDADERALPGLGVLFEIIWKDSSKEEQTLMVNTLYNHFQSAKS